SGTMRKNLCRESDAFLCRSDQVEVIPVRSPSRVTKPSAGYPQIGLKNCPHSRGLDLGCAPGYTHASRGEHSIRTEAEPSDDQAPRTQPRGDGIAAHRREVG